MKKTILTTIIVLSLIVFVSATAISISLSVKDADIKTESPEEEPNGFVGNLTYTLNGENKTCFIDEEKFSVRDLRKCIRSCKVDYDIGQLICPDKPTNIKFNGDTLQEVVIEGMTYYSFVKTELEDRECRMTDNIWDAKSETCSEAIGVEA